MIHLAETVPVDLLCLIGLDPCLLGILLSLVQLEFIKSSFRPVVLTGKSLKLILEGSNFQFFHCRLVWSR